MSSSPIEVHITSRPPSAGAVPPYPLDLQYPATASQSSSEAASSPPDSPLDQDYCLPAPLTLQLAAKHHPDGLRTVSPYSSSPTVSEYIPRALDATPSESHIHTVPLIPTLLPMPPLAADASARASSSKARGRRPQSEEEYCVPPFRNQVGPARTRQKAASAAHTSPLDQSASFDPSHPYARIYTRKEGAKRRKMWNHALEKSLFTPQEISTMGAPHRRTIYTASLEAHIDRLHAQLLNIALFPVPFEKLECYRGLNTKTAKSMVAGLHRDASELRIKRLELERATHGLRGQLYAPSTAPPAYPQTQMHHTAIGLRRHSLD